MGPTISCEGSPYKGDKDGEWRKTPHVQSYLVATDRWDCTKRAAELTSLLACLHGWMGRLQGLLLSAIQAFPTATTIQSP